MSEDKKIVLRSNVSGTVVVNMPELHRRLEFLTKGSKKNITQEMFEELSYNPGVEYMLKTGILTLENEEAKEELSYEIDVVDLTDALTKRMCTVMPIGEYKELLNKLTEPQLREVADYAIANSGKMTMERLSILQERSGIDINGAIRLKRQNEEPLPDKEG